MLRALWSDQGQRYYVANKYIIGLAASLVRVGLIQGWVHDIESRYSYARRSVRDINDYNVITRNRIIEIILS